MDASGINSTKVRVFVDKQVSIRTIQTAVILGHYNTGFTYENSLPLNNHRLPAITVIKIPSRGSRLVVREFCPLIQKLIKKKMC